MKIKDFIKEIKKIDFNKGLRFSRIIEFRDKIRVILECDYTQENLDSVEKDLKFIGIRGKVLRQIDLLDVYARRFLSIYISNFKSYFSSFYRTFSYKIIYSFLLRKSRFFLIAEFQKIRKFYNIYDFDICKDSKNLFRKYIKICYLMREYLNSFDFRNKDSVYIKLSFNMGNIFNMNYLYAKDVFKGEDYVISEFPKKYFWIPNLKEAEALVNLYIADNNQDKNIYNEWRKKSKKSIKCEEINLIVFFLERISGIKYEDFSQKTILKYQINQFISLKLINNKTEIFIKNKRFMICKSLIRTIDYNNIEEANEITSIDQLVNLPQVRGGQSITPDQEFWGHCSNIQVWADNDYNTKILHSNLSFPLLKKLTNIGDPIAKKVYKKEIMKRIEEDYVPTIIFLLNGKYLNIFDVNELKVLYHEFLNDPKKKSIINRIKNLIISKMAEEQTNLFLEDKNL